MIIDLTYACKMGCSHCISDCKPEGENMSLQQLSFSYKNVSLLKYPLLTRSKHRWVLLGNQPSRGYRLGIKTSAMVFLNIFIRRLTSKFEQHKGCYMVKNKRLEKEQITTASIKKLISVLQSEAINYEQYQQELQMQLDKMSEANKAYLSQYGTHRKVVLELLRFVLQSENFGKYNKEEYLHNLIYSNLWLIDERLAYADYIAVENPFNGAIKKRGPNIIMPDYPVAVSDEPNTGRVYETITILELDSLMRDDYTKTGNPITQILNYVGSLRTNKMKDKNGYLILTNESTQFYLYAVCNLTPKLRELAFDMDMMDTPDKKGMYKYHKNRNAHIKILSYDKMLNDAENRNNHKY